MRIIYFLVLILIIANPTYAFSDINTTEYPKSENVLPNLQTDVSVIKGTISKDFEMTLPNCIMLALGNNPQIHAAFQDILASDSRIKQVWSNYFPIVSWQSGYTRLKQLQLSDAFDENVEFNYFLLGQVSLQQMLYDFGVTQNQISIRKLDYEGYKKTFEATVNNVVYKTKNAYYTVLLNLANIIIAEDNVKKYELFYNQAKALYKVGQNPKVDVTIAETNLSNAKLNLIQAKKSLELSIANLNNVMGIANLEKYKINDKLKYNNFDLSFEDLIEITRESRPELRLAEIRVEGLNQTVKLTKKSFLPTISVEAQYQRGGKTFTSNYGYNIGGYLTFPNLNFMLIRNEIKEAQYLYDKELANAKDVQNNIYYEVQSAYYDLIEAKNKIPVAIISMKQAEENYELSFGRYKVGEATPTELKDAQNNYNNAQLYYYNTLFEYNDSKARLEKAIGKNII